MFKEFKAFISKGNVLDLAIGLILATHFGAIVKSLVDDIIMPPIGKVLGNVDFSKLQLVIQDASVNADGIIVPAVTINYGTFINTIITFIIVAFSVFLVVKGYNRMKARQEAEVVAVKGPTNEEKLLTEIRDLLKNK